MMSGKPTGRIVYRCSFCNEIAENVSDVCFYDKHLGNWRVVCDECLNLDSELDKYLATASDLESMHFIGEVTTYGQLSKMFVSGGRYEALKGGHMYKLSSLIFVRGDLGDI